MGSSKETKVEAINALTENYMPLMKKYQSYQNGDDEQALSTEELTVVRALITILNDLK